MADARGVSAVEEFQAQTDFPHHLGGNVTLGTVHGQALEIGKTFAQRSAADLENGPGLVALANLHMAGFEPQA